MNYCSSVFWVVCRNIGQKDEKLFFFLGKSTYVLFRPQKKTGVLHTGLWQRFFQPCSSSFQINLPGQRKPRAAGPGRFLSLQQVGKEQTFSTHHRRPSARFPRLPAHRKRPASHRLPHQGSLPNQCRSCSFLLK